MQKGLCHLGRLFKASSLLSQLIKIFRIIHMAALLYCQLQLQWMMSLCGHMSELIEGMIAACDKIDLHTSSFAARFLGSSAYSQPSFLTITECPMLISPFRLLLRSR